MSIVKKVSCLLIALAILFGGSCQHIHDDKCGYDQETNSGCQYICPINEWEPPIG